MDSVNLTITIFGKTFNASDVYACFTFIVAGLLIGFGCGAGIAIAYLFMK